MKRIMRKALAVLTVAAVVATGAPAQAAQYGAIAVSNSHPSVWIAILERWGYAERDPLGPQRWSDSYVDYRPGAVYIGSGWCARRYTGPARNGPWTRAGDDIRGPFMLELAGNYLVKIYPYRAASSSSCV
jgi:hypothetical protein